MIDQVGEVVNVRVGEALTKSTKSSAVLFGAMAIAEVLNGAERKLEFAG